MSMTQELINLGEKVGFKATELQAFMKEQQAFAREERDKMREAEREKQERENFDREKNRELEKMKLELEFKKLELGKFMAASEHEDEEEEEEDTGDTTAAVSKSKVRGPKLASFEESKDDIDSYIHRYEQYALLQGWKKESWAVYLAALLKGKALDVYARLTPTEANNYDVLKGALLKRFNKTEEGYKQQFYTSKAEVNESPQQFITRLTSYLTRWIELAKVELTFDGFMTLVVREQYLSTCVKELELFLRERAVTDLTELAKLAEQYMDAHRSKGYGWNRASKQTVSHEMENKTHIPVSAEKGAIAKKCFICNKTNHLAKQCFHRQKTSAMEATGPRRWNNDNRFSKPQSQTQNKTITKPGQQNSGMTRERKLKCKTHGKELCPDCFVLDSHECSAVLMCGCPIPVLADTCSTERRHRMPVTEGYLNGKKVTVLRDSGCSTVVVRRSLIEDELLTGAETVCVLIDGTVRRTPIAKVDIETKFFTGQVEAVCMRNPLYDLIIGNVDGVEDVFTEGMQEESQAVMTRQMRVNAEKNKTPLKVASEIKSLVSREELIQLQKDDESLKSSWDKVGKVEDSNEKGVKFIESAGLLYRSCIGYDRQVITQLVVPKILRQEVMRLAHDATMSGHQGIKRTRDRIFLGFWFPGMTAEVTRFCKSCDVCQRTIAKGRVSKVPLGSMPVIETPFERVAIDLVGPIYPASERGNRYLLTVVDYATRYPEAVALKDIQTETVAEALVDIYSRVGIPKEVLSDQGSQMVSNIMKELSRLLSVRQLVISPYHPICNGLVEKFNGTLKAMLKKVCAEKPKDWDRYLGPLLFAYREVRQESLGFSPFELVYGRSVRGPLVILKELWSKEEIEPEVKTTYEYVVDLRNRLQETCELAQQNLMKAQDKQRKYYNLKATKRVFEVGSKVLVLRPTDHNKLLMQWQGPFVVKEKRRENDYEIEMNGKTRLYHANMLKQYYERDNNEVSMGCVTKPGVVSKVYEVTNAAVIECQAQEDSSLGLYHNLQTETYKDVDINPELETEKRMQIANLLMEFQDIFTDVPRVCNLGEHEIKLTTNDPIRSRPYPIPYAMREALSKEIDTMLSLGIIEPSSSPYASPVVMVRKSDNSIRVCCDFRRLNRISVFDAECMPTADEIFAQLSGCNYFSKFDLSKGYWQVPMKESDKDYTAFTTHRGLFRFMVMPFGLVNAPATFSRIMRKLLYDVVDIHNYLDDVLAHSEQWIQHLCTLREFFVRVREANLTLRPTKCSIGYSCVKFLGFDISPQGLSPTPNNVNKALNACRPQTKTQLRSFLGMIGHYRRFIPNFAAVAVPLTDLTRKGSSNKLEWSEQHERAFVALKRAITNPPILRLPNVNETFVLQTDASNEGLGAVLLQEEEGFKYPIAYASRKLLQREKNYSTIERECLAIVFGIQKFHNFLYGQEFILETDHQPLKYLNQTEFQNGRVMRWSLALQPYRFTVRYIRGSQNVGADFLSRHTSVETEV